LLFPLVNDALQTHFNCRGVPLKLMTNNNDNTQTRVTLFAHQLSAINHIRRRELLAKNDGEPQSKSIKTCDQRRYDPNYQYHSNYRYNSTTLNSSGITIKQSQSQTKPELYGMRG